MKVAGGHIHSGRGNPQPPPLNDGPAICFNFLQVCLIITPFVFTVLFLSFSNGFSGCFYVSLRLVQIIVSLTAIFVLSRNAGEERCVTRQKQLPGRIVQFPLFEFSLIL